MTSSRPPIPGASPVAKTALVVGAGGAIGSHLVPELGRLGFSRITLCDPDAYEPRNILAQAVPEALGRRKVDHQREILSRINPSLQVTTIAAPIQHVPLGRLRCDLLLGCVDNRAARQFLSQAAVRWGIPFIDAGVEPDSLLARVSIFVPGPEAACMECGWSGRDYALLEQSLPCGSGHASDAPSNASSALGALAASLQALECQRILSSDGTSDSGAHQIVLSASHHRLWSTTLRRSPQCRFDHSPWEAEPMPLHGLTLAALLAKAATRMGSSSGMRVRVEGTPFVTRRECSRCGRSESAVRLRSRLEEDAPPCAACGSEMVTPGIAMEHQLAAAAIEDPLLEAPMSDWGVRGGDIVTVGNSSAARRFEMKTTEGS